MQHHAHLAALAPSVLSMFSRLWVYVTLGATSIFTEEAAPVLAGFAAHQHHLGVVQAVVACAIGSWAADIALYALGRWRAVKLATRWPKLMKPMEKLLGSVRRHPWRASIAVRYAYGARIVLPIACGAAEIPFANYLIGSGISCWSWSASMTAIGWAFGSTAVLVLGRIRRHEDVLAISLVAAIVLIVAVIALRNREKVPVEIDAGLRAFTLGDEATRDR
ncbi:MAG TPA: DedA family protein [Gemmatimonadaceae bacterium]|jgi:membrane protein DedA with SNARE-associated domain|nr:DedA family protein [Gemmatimonadaceae bacterium]